MQTKRLLGRAQIGAALAASLGLWAALGSTTQAEDAFIPRLINSSTIPANGDLNPYGVAFVPMGFPGGGTITGGALQSQFFTSSLPGLSTALGALRAGFVLVGNVPTTDGTFGTIGQGALQVVDRHGHLLQSWTDPEFLDGPWDLAIDD
jgi:hypothetical protein